MQPKRRIAGRITRRAVSYRDPSSNESSAEENEASSPAPAPPPLKKARPTTVPRSKASTPSKRSNRVSKKTHGKGPQKKIDVRARPVQYIETDGVIPAWSSLPYEILVEIFRHASYPLCDEIFRANESVNWLLRTARICKSFAEPALAVLYDSPPFFALHQTHKLLDLVSDKTAEHFIEYRPKIKRLDMDSKCILAFSTTGRGHFDIAALLPYLPRLSAIDISNDLNRPPYRYISACGRWHYPESLFDRLQECGTRLEEWRWNGDMFGAHFAGLNKIHATAPFQTLRRLYLSHLNLLSSPGADPSRRKTTDILADCLSLLPALSDLSLESCQSDNWNLLSQLSIDLASFTVINCSTLDSEVLQTFLQTHGSHLKYLTLNHNRSLDLTWLTSLKLSCPALVALEVDLSYYSASVLGSISHQSDTEPLFEELLQPLDVPSWPPKLSKLSILDMRKWTTEAAISFFESLIHSASSLPYLRTLAIKAMLDISWRDRATFREKWIGDLQETFMRVSKPPSPHLASNKRFREWKEKCKELVGRPSTRRISLGTGGRDGDTGGTCEAVDIKIDNMRPSEVRFREEDFVDSEQSGDEDWNEANDETEAPVYAW